MSGSITYNGEGFDSFQVARTVAYVSQTDVHQAQLTVRETMDFAARCLGTGHKQSESNGGSSTAVSCLLSLFLTV
jgi:ABC-type multidrug transport system ATPase subunit